MPLDTVQAPEQPVLEITGSVPRFMQLINAKGETLVSVNMENGNVRILSKDKAAVDDAAKIFWQAIGNYWRDTKCQPDK